MFQFFKRNTFNHGNFTNMKYIFLMCYKKKSCKLTIWFYVLVKALVLPNLIPVFHLTQNFIWQMLQVISLVSQRLCIDHLQTSSFYKQSFTHIIYYLFLSVLYTNAYYPVKSSQIRKTSNVIAILGKISYA